MSVSAVGTVDLVEVDPVGAQPPKAILDLLDDPATRVSELVGIVAHRPVDLGCQHDVVALAAGQRLANDLFGPTTRVDISGVDEVDSRVQRPVDDADAIVAVRVAPVPEHHRAQT
jgi:hypothetical protein